MSVRLTFSCISLNSRNKMAVTSPWKTSVAAGKAYAADQVTITKRFTSRFFSNWTRIHFGFTKKLNNSLKTDSETQLMLVVSLNRRCAWKRTVCFHVYSEVMSSSSVQCASSVKAYTNSWIVGELSPSSGGRRCTPDLGYQHLPCVLHGGWTTRRCSAVSSTLPGFSRSPLQVQQQKQPPDTTFHYAVVWLPFYQKGLQWAAWWSHLKKPPHPPWSLW